MLSHDLRGSGPRVVLAHGFTQNRACWGTVREQLDQHFETMAVDLPGHGDSGTALTVSDAAHRLGDTGGRAAYLGYSMGARHVLELMVTRPELVRAAVLISGTAGFDDPAQAAARRADDEQHAATLERDGLDEFLDTWLSAPMFATLPGDARFQKERATNDAAGLAGSLRLAGTGSMTNRWPELGRATMPVLVLAGALDPAYVEIARRLTGALRDAELVVVDDAGHAVHLEQPLAVAEAVTAFLTLHLS